MDREPGLLKFVSSRIHSIYFAIQGFIYVLKTQQNAWIHLVSTIIIMLVSLWLKISRGEWIAILLVIGMVWTAEFLNTALEIITNLASPEKHPMARLGKDIGAAAVLISAVLAIIIGVIVLGPALAARLGW